MIEFFIAKKHMIERKKQSFISMLGVLIGVTVLTVSIGISNGLDKNMIESMLSLSSHVVVTNPVRDVRDYDRLRQEIETLPGVKAALPWIEGQGLLKYRGIYGAFNTGVKIEAYPLNGLDEAMQLTKMLSQGNFDKEKRNAIYIGKELALSAGMQVGDELQLISADNVELPLEITGIFESGFYEYDMNFVIVPLEVAQYISYRGESVDKFNVRLEDPYDAPAIADEISEKTGLMSMTWGSMNRNLLSALALEKTVMILVFSLIVVIAGFVVWLSLNTLVREKIKDIGILRSMGFSRENIMKIFLIQGLVLGILGILLGLAISFALLWYLKNYSLDFISSIYYLRKLPIEISLKEVGIIVGANVFVILLSSVFPAYRAARMESVEALRHE